MSKIDRNIDVYDRLMLRTSQLKECQDELTALRAWKAKATPFLEEAVRTIHEYYHPAINPPIDDSIWEEEKKDLEILTELLGGSDEN